ncbi:hypothetical protein [Vibrio sp. D431a]|uniref:hypothetical protein n=1 Tax=Vibrio sp. D431a TaxID=2837388 RepID=UPI002555B7F0|nr:hypothetical protein [Vibrio sp. D431a]MDK9793732.1 hypothetical protein [Vibrio sp. D431a]
MGNLLRGGFEGEFSSIDEAWDNLSSMFLLAFPCEALADDGVTMVEDLASSRSVNMYVYEVNSYGYFCKNLCRKGHAKMAERIPIDPSNFTKVHPMFLS